jgi:hypothetical protein
LSLEQACGCRPELKTRGGSLVEARVDATTVREIFAHWQRLAADDLPSLRALHLSPDGAIFRLVLDLREPGRWFCLETTPVGELPDFSAVWPHCRWWQDELATFAGLVFEGKKEEGVSWRLA